mgnify:CR=1 FL=1
MSVNLKWQPLADLDEATIAPWSQLARKDGLLSLQAGTVYLPCE